MMSLENIWPVEDQRIDSSNADKMPSFLLPLRQSAQADDTFYVELKFNLKLTLM
jgi:hypothetical protein